MDPVKNSYSCFFCCNFLILCIIIIIITVILFFKYLQFRKNEIISGKIYHHLYEIFSYFYLCSYSTKFYESIYDFHTKFIMLDKESNCLFTVLPWKEKFRFFIIQIIIFYYITFSLNIINYSETIRFIFGDVTINFVTTNNNDDNDDYNLSEKYIAMCFGFCSQLFMIGIYQTFNSRSSKSFRTFILLTKEFHRQNDDDEKIVSKYDSESFRQYSPSSSSSSLQSSLPSPSSSIIIDYIIKQFSLNFNHFRSLFDHFYCLVILFHCK